jgi:Asp-tRNA(Asn)/Glu-tRNA(Gln) amidotransferase A subunit family amidase
VAALDSPLVARLRQAGAILLRETNGPQLGLMIETDTPFTAARTTRGILDDRRAGPAVAKRHSSPRVVRHWVWAPTPAEASASHAPGPDSLDPLVPPVAMGDPSAVSTAALRVAMHSDDGYFAAAPAIEKAVSEAATALRELGSVVELFGPPDVEEAMLLCFAHNNGLLYQGVRPPQLW